MAQYYRFKRENAQRNPGVVSFKEAFERLLDTYKLHDKFDASAIPAKWEEIMGQPVSARTKNIYVKNNTLFLQLDSAPLRAELVRAKSKIIANINAEFGKTLINDIVFY